MLHVPVEAFLSEVEELGLAKKCLTKNAATMTKWELTNFLARQTSQARKKKKNNLFGLECIYLIYALLRGA